LYDEAWFGCGACLEKMEKWSEANHHYTKALKLHTENSEYWKAVAHSDFKIGHIPRSLESYEEAAKLDPTDKEIWLNWSFIHYDQGEFERAIGILAEGFAEIPDDSEMFYRMTVYLIAGGKFKEAFNYLENALILDFDGHTILFEFFPQLETQKALYKIIEQFRKENS
jgi:tetratricopeptide (TPR) repeat protein